jgi:CBS domain containing-hemolysin-like protein
MVMSYPYIFVVFFALSLILYALNISLASYSLDKKEEIFKYRALLPIKFIKNLLPSKDYQSLMALFSLTKIVTLLIFFISGFLFFLLNGFPYSLKTSQSAIPSIPFLYFLFSAGILSLICLVSLGICKIITSFSEKFILKIFSFPATFPLLLFFPLTYPIILLQNKLSIKKKQNISKQDRFKDALLNILSSEEHNSLDPSTKKLVYSLAYFGKKTCREVMVPRIKIQCLQNTSSIFEAITLFVEDGYSRLPIYENSIDHITGVLLYKDVFEYTFKKNINNLEMLKSSPITSLVTPILYAPENKAISELFQVMRIRKIHAAIIVNEYGCTEGLITIEDIFEELIGNEILDEHDQEEDLLYKKTHDKGWIVEANLSIIDAEREFGINLPHHPEYETIGGFICSTMGIIPKPGSVIYHDKYEIKVLSSDKRKIEKVKITFDNN